MQTNTIQAKVNQLLAWAAFAKREAGVPVLSGTSYRARQYRVYVQLLTHADMLVHAQRGLLSRPAA